MSANASPPPASSIVEYAGIFLYQASGKTQPIKLCDTVPIHKPIGVAVQESAVKTIIKSNANAMNNDVVLKKSLSFSHSYFLYTCGEDVYFAFICKLDASEDKIDNFYTDLKRDITQACWGNLSTLQKGGITEG